VSERARHPNGKWRRQTLHYRGRGDPGRFVAARERVPIDQPSKLASPATTVFEELQPPRLQKEETELLISVDLHHFFSSWSQVQSSAGWSGLSSGGSWLVIVSSSSLSPDA
jgi:hypothetical protein